MKPDTWYSLSHLPDCERPEAFAKYVILAELSLDPITTFREICGLAQQLGPRATFSQVITYYAFNKQQEQTERRNDNRT